MDIKAIETFYKGYRFRSRLEARWAVFFDAFGAPYEYEKEGFDINSQWYLPDFWVPEIGDRFWEHGIPQVAGRYIEIKPNNPTLEQFNLVKSLATKTRHWCHILIGNPWPTDVKIQSFSPLGVGTFKEKLTITDLRPEFEECFTDFPMIGFNSIFPAFEAARQARFEHGETPSVR